MCTRSGLVVCAYICFFFFNDTATTEIYTLSLHDALPIFGWPTGRSPRPASRALPPLRPEHFANGVRSLPYALKQPAQKVDRKSTRLNSSHANISYAVFCLKKKTLMLNYHLSDVFIVCVRL